MMSLKQNGRRSAAWTTQQGPLRPRRHARLAERRCAGGAGFLRLGAAFGSRSGGAGVAVGLHAAEVVTARQGGDLSRHYQFQRDGEVPEVSLADNVVVQQPSIRVSLRHPATVAARERWRRPTRRKAGGGAGGAGGAGLAPNSPAPG